MEPGLAPYCAPSSARAIISSTTSLLTPAYQHGMQPPANQCSNSRQPSPDGSRPGFARFSGGSGAERTGVARGERGSFTSVDAAPPERAGIASSVINASRQVGVVLGVALLGALVNRQGFFVPGMHVAPSPGAPFWEGACSLCEPSTGPVLRRSLVMSPRRNESIGLLQPLPGGRRFGAYGLR